MIQTHNLTYKCADRWSQHRGANGGEVDEGLGPDLLRNRDKLIDRDLDVNNDDSEQSIEFLQSLHHCSVGYQSV
jgi:hypothetical protein